MMKRKVLFSVLLSSASLLANPTDPKIVNGGASVTSTNNRVTVAQSSDKAIIEWKNFSIKENEQTRFMLPSETSAILNRVTGNLRSEILGTIDANGKVYLVNPNGILIGPEGEIRAHSFIGSTLDIKNDEFLQKETFTFHGESNEKIVNEGLIEAWGGNIVLVARDVSNLGSVKAVDGNISLIGAREIILSEEESPNVGVVVNPNLVTSDGEIEAIHVKLQACAGNIYSLAINQEGVVDAEMIQDNDGKLSFSTPCKTFVSGEIRAADCDYNKGGEIHILGEEVTIDENTYIKASGDHGGGTILIGGDTMGKNSDVPNSTRVTIEDGALIEANSNVMGNGGKVIIYSTDYSKHFGHIEARANGYCGDGGFAEVSANQVEIPDFPDLISIEGKDGTFLIDPGTVHIVPGSSTGPDTFGDSHISGLLASGSVIINTSAATGALGANETIFISTTVGQPINITWGSNNDLSLVAGRDIQCTAATGNTINATAGGGISMNAQNTGNNLTDADIAALNIVDANFATNSGTQTYTANGNVTAPGTNTNLRAINFANSNIQSVSGNIIANGTTDSNTGVRVDLNSIINTTGSGNIQFTGTGSSRGILVNPGFVQTSGSGSITMNGTGTGAAVSNRSIGVRYRNCSITSATGDITLTGTGNSNGIECDTGGGGLSTTGGNITMTGTVPGGTDLSLYGVEIFTTISSTADSSKKISITGTAYNTGVTVDNGAITSTNGASIEITGIATKSDANPTFFTFSQIGGASTTGDIIITTDDRISNSNSPIQTSGSITIRQRTLSKGLNVAAGSGGGAALGLLSSLLDQLQDGFSEIILGRPDATGNTLVYSYTFKDLVTIYGNNLQVAGGNTLNGNGNDISLISNTIDIAGSVQSTGAQLTLHPISTSSSIGLGEGFGIFNINNSEIGRLNDGFSQITIGKTDGTYTVDIGNGAGTTVNFTDPLTIIGGLIRLNTNDTLDGNGNAINLTSEQIELNGTLQSTGANLSLQPINTTTNIGLGGGTGTYNLTSSEIANISDGFTQITIGRNDANNTVDIGDGLGSTLSFTDPLVVNATNLNVNNPINSTNNDSIQFNVGIGADSSVNINEQVNGNLFAITGGAFNDTFVVADAITISGILNGGGGTTNTLDYSSWTSPVTVDLATDTASNFFSGAAGGIPNITDYIAPPTPPTPQPIISDVRARQFFANLEISFDLMKTMHFVEYRRFFPKFSQVIKPIDQRIWQEITDPKPPIDFFSEE